MKEPFKKQVLQRIREAGVIAVLVVDEVEDAVPLARSLLDGGVKIMELTLRTPAALDALRAIRDNVPEMMAGIGTILTPRQVKDVANAGAAFGVAPGTNPNVVKAALDSGLSFAPGVATPSDIETALELECRALKFFPAEPSGGMPYLKSMAGPYKHLELTFMPLGGINARNMSAYLKEDMIPAVGGSWLAKRDVIRNHDWQTITENAREATQIIRKLQGE